MQQQNLYPNIFASENLEASWQAVRRNKGAPGIDGQAITRITEQWPLVKERLRMQLQNETYRPSPGRRVYIPKPNGKKRPLGIPTVRDRIVQQALRRILEPILDPTFEDFSFGFRPGKSAKQALDRVDKILQDGQRWVVQIDLEQFFDTIPHETIIAALQKHIQDPKVYALIQRFLNAGVMEEGKVRHTTTGTPQGGVISPLLANLVLDAVDTYVISHGEEGMVRYADDFVILAKTKRRAEHIYKEVVSVLQKLGLNVNQEKSHIAHISERFIFLGYEFGGGGYFPGDGGTTVAKLWKRIAKKAITAFKDKMRYLTRRLQPRNIQMLKEKLNPVIRGWGNYFKEGYYKTSFLELDSWYRMRLRAFLHKKKSYLDNYKYPVSFFKETGYLFLGDLVVPRQLALRV